MHWYYTSWAFTYLAYLNNLPINVHYFTQRETWTQVFSKNSIKPASQLSSLKRVRWNVTKTLTLSEIHRTGSIVGASANWEAPCLSLRKKVDIFCLLVLSLFELPHCLQFSSLFFVMKEMCFALSFQEFPTGFVVWTWEERQNEEKTKPKTKPNPKKPSIYYFNS